ncbi:hypothetical protein SAMD00079811_52880 [Scytonema sp. HK-05]|uniref:hypothetical protein n=1 Tax=Scytonema sp. HK-05 TaxID=1137095 RepID=UPI000936CAB8|nr:hypothetical protein [Scytonema sp. HK-05]OKH48971.1 hypothetical protein NIES2130_35020 [Scytonema sp. HK-05]BAY47669.1 hypothetical protein SAMD00079811_52880 [Scytonema sp. HK-05]
MSQKANTQLILPEPSEELIASEPWSIETYADNLMDELFAEIDRILDGNDNLPSQTVLQEDIRQVQTVTVPEIVVPETQLRPIQIAQARNNPLSTLVVGTPAVSRQASKSSQKSQRTNSIVLWVAVTIGLAAASILWVFNSGLLNRLVSKSLYQSLLQPQAQSPLPTKAQIEADLVNYMLGALSVIDRQEAKSSIRSASSANQTALAYITPQPVGANHIASAPSQSTRVVERIYIPVYQAPQPMRYAPPPTAGTFNSATVSESSLGKASKPAPVKTAQPTTTVQALAAVRPELKAVSPKRATDAAASPSLVSENQEVASTVSTADVTAPSHTLEKLFELGNKSAALFKIDGVTRRVEVGEAIGASGWTLVKIAKGEVTIRRNGEVRSIYTGQTF